MHNDSRSIQFEWRIFCSRIPFNSCTNSWCLLKRLNSYIIKDKKFFLTHFQLSKFTNGIFDISRWIRICPSDARTSFGFVIRHDACAITLNKEEYENSSNRVEFTMFDRVWHKHNQDVNENQYLLNEFLQLFDNLNAKKRKRMVWLFY